ncbi:MAG: FUN14 domain-containing protein [Trueperaceae bacterium]|nr:FUN14 domain-containing protein [Trueperaceae bacterium]
MDVDLPALFPYAEQLGFGLVAGFAVGYALKKVGKLAAVALGLVFILVQTLAYVGFITVNWGEVQARVDPLFEGDSLTQAWQGLLGVLTFNLAFAGAFVPGLVLGLKRG